jgi:hypothetical protein
VAFFFLLLLRLLQYNPLRVQQWCKRQTGMSCNDANMKVIDGMFAQFNYRNLRHANNQIQYGKLNFQDDVIGDRERTLPYYPPHCKNICMCYARGTCLSADYKGISPQARENGSESKLPNCYFSYIEISSASPLRTPIAMYFYKPTFPTDTPFAKVRMIIL